MFSFKKHPATVEQIHKEFDDAEEKIIKECENVLNNLQVVTESKLEKKATELIKLGFIASEPVKQYQELKEKSKFIEQSINSNKEQLNTFNELKQAYPLEKFITVDELERICKKYNLIHAPVKNYIMDIPEKNVLEISRTKKLNEIHSAGDSVVLIGLKSDYLLNLFGKKEPIFTVNDLKRINFSYISLESWFNSGNNTWAYVAVKDGIDGKPGLNEKVLTKLYSYDKIQKIDKSGLFIAAPETHFDLKDLKKKSKFGFFEVENRKVPKDPVVFEYCKNNLCRIITKWGTKDDQSYLDEALTNETNN